MRRGKRNPFVKSARHAYGMALVLEFGEPVEARRATEVARRLLESVQIGAPDEAAWEDLQTCRLVCREMRQMVSLIPPSSPRE